MKVTDTHWLDTAERHPIIGGKPMNIRRCLVIHFTNGASALSSLDYNRRNGLSCHLYIDRDGTILQARPFNRTCGHAGKAGQARWRDPNTGKLYGTPNNYGIGIELANAGDDEQLARRMSKLPLIASKHRNGGSVKRWEQFPNLQFDACVAVARTLVARYDLDDITGHDCIAPERKNDPGPAFPMKELREACGFYALPVVHQP